MHVTHYGFPSATPTRMELGTPTYIPTAPNHLEGWMWCFYGREVRFLSGWADD